MARVPGSEAVPEVKPRQDRGLATAQRITPAVFGSELAVVAEKTGTREVAILTAMNLRAQGVARDKDDTEFSTQLGAKLRELQTSGVDLADNSVIDEAGKFAEDLKNQILEAHTGSPESRAMLANRLNSRINAFAGTAGGLSAHAKRTQLSQSVDRRINAIVASGKPLPESFDALEKDIQFLGLGSAEATAARAKGRAAIAQNMITVSIARGQTGRARTLLNDQALVSVLPPNVRTGLQARVIAAERAQGSAARDMADRIRGFEAVTGTTLTTEQRQRLLAKKFFGVDDFMNVKRNDRDEFSRNLNRMLELEKDGKKDTPEYKARADRLAKMTQKTTGMSMTFDPETGRFTVTQGPQPGGLGSTLTGKQALGQKAQLDRLKTTIGLLDTTIGLIKERPSTAGVIGSIRNFAQKLAGVAEDAAPEAVAARVRSSLALLGVDDATKGRLGGFFDPGLPETEIYANTIALELAKLRITSGAKGVRAIESAFKAARKDVQVRGLFSSNEALTRLEAVRREFQTALDKLSQRLSGTTAKSVAPDATTKDAPEGSIARTPDGKVFIRKGDVWMPLQETPQKGDK